MKQRGFNTLVGVFALLFFIIVVVSGLYLWTVTRDDTSTATIPPQTSSQGGTIATLGQVPGQTQNTQPAQQPTEQTTEPQVAAAETDVSTLPYVFTLPAGWAETNKVSAADPCGSDATVLTTTYTNQQETITVYENGTPFGCGNEQVPDVYLDFNYTDDFTGITIDENQPIVQCSKDDNPACPKGDGSVTVFIGNEDVDQANVQLTNELNGRTYMFSINDSQFDGDLSAQVKSFLSLITAIQFE